MLNKQKILELKFYSWDPKIGNTLYVHQQIKYVSTDVANIM